MMYGNKQVNPLLQQNQDQVQQNDKNQMLQYKSQNAGNLVMPQASGADQQNLQNQFGQNQVTQEDVKQMGGPNSQQVLMQKLSKISQD